MDPFVPEDPGYRADKFYTGHGDRASESREVNVKVDPLQYDLVHRLFVAPEDKFGEYRGLSDFIADAMHHRLMWLMQEYPQLDTPEIRKKVATVTAAFAGRTIATNTVTRVETIRRLIDGIGMASDHDSWGDEDTLAQLIEEARVLLPDLNDREQADLIIAMADGRRALKELKAKGQQSLQSAHLYAKETDPFQGEFDTGFNL